jgi:hypothetical protein
MRRAFNFRVALPTMLAIQAVLALLVPGYITGFPDSDVPLTAPRVLLALLNTGLGIWFFLSWLEHNEPGSVFGPRPAPADSAS